MAYSFYDDYFRRGRGGQTLEYLGVVVVFMAQHCRRLIVKKIITNHARSHFYYYSILLFHSGYCNFPSLFSQDFNYSKEYFSDTVRGFGYVGV
jgi:hypothetical protein